MSVLTPEFIPPANVAPEDVAAMSDVVARITAAWNANDAATLCAVYADDATVVLPGAILKGREAIEKWMTEAFEGKWKGTHVLGHPLELRYLAEDVMGLASHGGAYNPGDTEVPTHFAIRGAWVFIKRDGEWLVHFYANTPVYDTIVLPETHL